MATFNPYKPSVLFVANSADLDQMPQIAMSGQGLYCLLQECHVMKMGGGNTQHPLKQKWTSPTDNGGQFY